VVFKVFALILASLLAVFTELFGIFPQSLQVNSGVVS